jgi:hypothetical protein
MSLFPQRKNRNLGPIGRKASIIPQAISPEQADRKLTTALRGMYEPGKSATLPCFLRVAGRSTEKIKIFLYSPPSRL